jgi:type IV pilus assembly protein PilW
MTRKNPLASKDRQRGMTLIELMVAVVIGLVVTLAVTSAVTFGESTKRSTTSTNDMGQSGSYAAYLLDRAVRSAGSGFAQSWDLGVFGCKLNASRGATAILPRASAFPVPFDKFLDGAAGSADLRIAPLMIASGQGADGLSDVLVVMGGNAASGDVPRIIRSSGASTNIVRLDNTIGMKQDDMALISQSGTQDCLLEQVSASPAFADAANNETLPLGGTYYTAGDGTLAALAGSGSAYLSLLGNAGVTNVQFQLFGVGANRTLFSYDLLRGAGNDDPQAIAEGVVRMQALYGLVDPTTGKFTNWVKPTDDYAISSVMTTPLKARSIAAVRIALVLRSSNYEKEKDSGEKVAASAYKLFSELPAALQQTVDISTEDQHYRHRVVDFTIPLRNILLLPSS